jgi:hypothetical protein
MNPEIDQLLSQSFLTLALDLAPALPTDYAKSSAGTTAMLLRIAAVEYERGAAIRVAENEDLRHVLVAAAPHVDDAALRTRIADATSVTDESLLISSLNATNASLRQLLIALHTYVETRDDADARRLDAMIWAALRRSTERRALPRLG